MAISTTMPHLLARQHNASNRRFFRESGSLLRVPPLLLLPPSHTKTDATTVTLAARLLWQLLAGGGGGTPDGDASETQDSLLSQDVLGCLVALLVEPATATDPSLRLQAVHLV